MTADFIRPADAFRMILRAVYPQNPRLPERIKSYQFFEKGQRKYGYRLASKSEPAKGAAPEHLHFPHEALRILADGVRAQKVVMQGSRDAVPPLPIPGADCADGDLDVFAETLAIGKNWQRPDYLYRRVWCSRADVLALVAEYLGPTTAPRHLSKRSIPDYVAAYIKDDVNPTIDGLGERAIRDGIVGGREMLRAEFRRQRIEHGHVVGKRGPRKSETRAN
jgi:hypothetical protein